MENIEYRMNKKVINTPIQSFFDILKAISEVF